MDDHHESEPPARRRRWPWAVAALAAVLIGGWSLLFFGPGLLMGGATSDGPPPVATGGTIEQAGHKTSDKAADAIQYRKAKDALGEAASGMQEMQKMALTFDVDGIKKAGAELKAKAAVVAAEAAKVRDKKLRALLLEAVDGLEEVARGAMESDADASYSGVDKVLKTFPKLPA